jgi:hypothetical protein
MALCFSIKGWKAWHPTQDDLQPDVSMIPAMLRRRLSPMARAAFSVMIPLADTFGAMPIIYVSRHGEVGRTIALLEDLNRQEPLSPTAFGLSVHNAIPGLFSIHQKITSNINAMAAGSQDLVAALVEAIGLCSEQEPQVLCVFCDEPLPSVYQGFVTQPEKPYALAVVISRGNDWQLTPTTLDSVESASEPQALSLLRLLEQGDHQLLLGANQLLWKLEQRLS